MDMFAAGTAGTADADIVGLKGKAENKKLRDDISDSFLFYLVV